MNGDKPRARSLLFVGNTGTGKTTASRAAASVFGPADAGDLPTFDFTARALEELCSAHNDRLLVIDEAGRAGDTPTAREQMLARLAYCIPSGQGRKRSRAVQGELKDQVWRVLVLASSEESFYRAPNAKASRKGGEAVRLIEIPVPRPEAGGIYDGSADDGVDLGKRGARLNGEVEQIISKHHGVAIVPFIEAPVADQEGMRTRFRELADRFVGEKLGAGPGSEQRIAKKFGLVYAAGVLAIECGCAPFTEVEIERACKWVFDASLRQMGLRRKSPIGKVARHLLAEADMPHFFPARRNR